MFISYGVIILAAGKGTRFGSEKQHVIFKGKELWDFVLSRVCEFVPRCNVVVVGVDTKGGVTRSMSVINGLKFLEAKKLQFERLLILEAARPLVTDSQYLQILEDSHPSSTFALPLVSTIVSKEGKYLDRNQYYRLSTPVAFNYSLFKDAYFSGKFTDLTDDTRIMFEQYGITPFFIMGDENLLKITYKSDLLILNNLAERFGF